MCKVFVEDSFDFYRLHRINVPFYSLGVALYSKLPILHSSSMFSFVKKRKQFYIIAVALSAISALSPFIIDVNLGIDMTGGIQIEYTTEGGDPTMAEATAKEYAEAIKKTIVFEEKPIMNDVSVYGIAGSDSFIVEAGFTTPENASEADIEKLKTQFSTTLTEKLASYQ